MSFKRLLEIKRRKSELEKNIENLTGEELTNALKEADELVAEEKELRNKEASSLEEIEKRAVKITIPELQKKDEEKPSIIDTPEYRFAYLKRLQGKKLNEIEERALTTADASVGAVIPTQTMNKIVEKLEQQGVIYPNITSLAIPSNIKLPVEGETEECSWVEEGNESTPSEDTITSVSLGAMELIKTLDITAHVEAMSIDQFENFIVALLARKVRKAIDYAIINGDGKKQALGILKAKEDEIKETTGEEWTYKDIIALKRSLKSGYFQNAMFIMSSTTLGAVECIEDKNGKPIFKEDSDKGFGTLSNKPVKVYDNMPDDTIIFGDLDFYYFNFVKNFAIDKDTSIGFKSGKTCYRALALCDGKPALKEAFAVIKKKSA